MSDPASLTAIQCIQSGFQTLADNTSLLSPASNSTATDSLNSKNTSNNPLNEMLVKNIETSQTIQSLAKVIKTEDLLLGNLLDTWS